MRCSASAEEANKEIIMSEQKPSLEAILDEYSPDNEEPKTRVGRVDAQKIINSTVESPDIVEKAKSRPPVSHEKSALFDNALRSDTPADDVKPADLSRHKIAVVSSDAMSEIRTNPQRKVIPSGTITPVQMTPDEAPKIRRMSESTRAKEVQSAKKRSKKRRGKDNDYTYARETPEGEYMYTPPEFKKKKRSRIQIIQAAESPEGKKQITDIVPSPAAVEAAKPVEPAPRAELTSINLSEKADINAGQLDVHITQEADEFMSLHSKSKRTKRIVDFNYYGDVEDVGRDIYELKSTISVRVFILAMTAFLSLFITVTNQFELPVLDFLSMSHIKTYLTIHLVLGAVSVLSSMAVITKGLRKLLSFKADSDSMTAVTALSCLIAIIPAFMRPDLVSSENIHIYMPVGILALLINAIGKLLIIRRAARNFKFVSKNFDRHGVTYVTDEDRAERITRGTLGDFPILASMRKTDFLTDFLRYTYSSDMTDDFCRKASPLCLIASIIVALFLTFFCKGTFASMEAAAFGFSIFSMIICATSCIAMPFVVNIPLENVSKSAIRNKGIMLGYQSVDDFYDTNSILIDAGTLFPEGTVRLDGIKVFSNTKLDEALLEAASLTANAGSIMSQLFTDVIAGRNGALYPIDNYSYEEGMGMCGWINNKRVLFGNRELMTSHNIEGVPTKTQEAEFVDGRKDALYLSISGNLAALFVVDIVADRYVKKWAKKLAKQKICMFIKSIDPCITLKKLNTLFGIPEEMARILPKKLHEDFYEETKKAVRLSVSMATTGKFASLAELIIGTKVVHSSAIIGLILQSASILLGFVLCMLLILSKAFQSNFVYMSATALTVYNIAWTALTYIAVSLKKT
jgi:Cu+-exporting ATPase